MIEFRQPGQDDTVQAAAELRISLNADQVELLREQRTAAQLAAEDEAFREAHTAWKAKHFLSVDQLFSLRPAEPLIAGNYLFVGTTVWLVGASGSYKSFVAVDWALSIATGRPWLGHAARRGRILYICCEDASGVGLRARVWLKRRGLTVDDVRGSAVFMGPENLLDPTTRAHLVEAVKDGDFALLVVDTQARATPGVDENKKNEMDPYIDLLTRIASEYGTTTISIHHSSKGGAMIRGSGSIEGAADSVFEIVKIADLQAELTTKKQKNTPSGDVLPLTLTPYEGSLILDPGFQESEMMAFKKLDNESFKKLTGAALEILSYVGMTGMSRTELAREVRAAGAGLRMAEVTAMDAYRVMSDLEDRSLVSLEGGTGERRQGARVSLSRVGETALEWYRSHGYASRRDETPPGRPGEPRSGPNTGRP